MAQGPRSSSSSSRPAVAFSVLSAHFSLPLSLSILCILFTLLSLRSVCAVCGDIIAHYNFGL